MSKLKQLNQRPIAYYPIYRQLAGSTAGGILLSQLMYWLAKKDKIYKTDADIKSETLFTDNELRGAKTKLKSLSFITITREGIPAKTFYKIDWDEYEKVLNSSLNSDSEKDKTSSVKTTNTVSLNSLNCDSEIHEPIYSTSFDTETTTETTTESNNIPISFLKTSNPCNGKDCTCKKGTIAKLDNKFYCGQHLRIELQKIGRIDLMPIETKSPSLKSQIEAKLSEYQNINLEAFNEWIEHKSYKAIGPVTKLLNFLSKYNFSTQQQIIDMSIMNNWQGLFPPKQQNSNMSYKRQDEQYTRDSVNAFFEMKEQGFDITKENNGMPLNNTSTQDAEILEY